MSIEDFTTNDYAVEIGEHESMSIYKIVNRQFGVMEYQDHLLPRVLDTLFELQERLDASRQKLSKGATPAPAGGTLIEGNFTKSDDPDGLH